LLLLLPDPQLVLVLAPIAAYNADISWHSSLLGLIPSIAVSSGVGKTYPGRVVSFLGCSGDAAGGCRTAPVAPPPGDGVVFVGGVVVGLTPPLVLPPVVPPVLPVGAVLPVAGGVVPGAVPAVGGTVVPLSVVPAAPGGCCVGGCVRAELSLAAPPDAGLTAGSFAPPVLLLSLPADLSAGGVSGGGG
jgi:hypothetical protein